MTSDRLISGTKTVGTGFSVATELTAARLNGRPVSDIVTTDTIQEVAGPLVFAAGTLHVDALSVNELVGGVDTARLVRYSGAEKLTGGCNGTLNTRCCPVCGGLRVI